MAGISLNCFPGEDFEPNSIRHFLNDMVNCADESTGAATKSLCNKLLMGTVKRDIPAVEASYELSSLPLYRSFSPVGSVEE
jgi:hypothetical protein